MHGEAGKDRVMKIDEEDFLLLSQTSLTELQAEVVYYDDDHKEHTITNIKSIKLWVPVTPYNSKP